MRFLAPPCLPALPILTMALVAGDESQALTPCEIKGRKVVPLAGLVTGGLRAKAGFLSVLGTFLLGMIKPLIPVGVAVRKLVKRG